MENIHYLEDDCSSTSSIILELPSLHFPQKMGRNQNVETF